MFNPTTVSRPYAKAAYEHAKERGNVEDWLKMLLLFSRCVDNTQMRTLLTKPSSSHTDLLQFIFSNIIENNYDMSMTNFLHVVAENKRLNFITYIHASFLTYSMNDNGVKVVSVVLSSSKELSFYNKLAEYLKKEYSSKIIIKRKIDPEIIGGVVIKVDDKIVDASIRGRIVRLIKTLQI